MLLMILQLIIINDITTPEGAQLEPIACLYDKKCLCIRKYLQYISVTVYLIQCIKNYFYFLASSLCSKTDNQSWKKIALVVCYHFEMKFCFP